MQKRSKPQSKSSSKCHAKHQTVGICVKQYGGDSFHVPSSTSRFCCGTNVHGDIVMIPLTYLKTYPAALEATMADVDTVHACLHRYHVSSRSRSCDLKLSLDLSTLPFSHASTLARCVGLHLPRTLFILQGIAYGPPPLSRFTSYSFSQRSLLPSTAVRKE